MTFTKVAPFGHWESPIDIKSVIYEQRTISSPRVHPRLGRTFFIESRKSGGNTIMGVVGSSVRDILPGAYSVENRVYEYGGSLYDVLPSGKIIFSNENDTVQILDPDTQQVSPLLDKHGYRYSSFDSNCQSPWILAIEEHHGDAVLCNVTHHIVAINVTTAEVKRVITGADFYYSPCFSIDGTRVAWLEWDHPGLPFDAAKLFVADWSGSGSINHCRMISGDEHSSTTEPRWGYDGSLFFAQEVRGYRQLFRTPPHSTAPSLLNLTGLEECEFGEVDLIEGSRTFTPLSEQQLVATVSVKGVHKLIVVDLETESWREIIQSEPICQVNLDAIARHTDSSFLVVGKTMSNPQTLYKIDVHQPERSRIIRRATTDDRFEDAISMPEPLCIPSKSSPCRNIYGFLWMPHNHQFKAPTGHLPPLIIDAHGGPSWTTGCGLSLKAQYFTSRGYAYVGLNYTGSTGYGQEYREALFGNWGIVDAADAAECAQYLANNGHVRANGIGISGHSAGGYLVLQCLTLYPHVFAGGVCAAGVSDLESFDSSTHKLEFHYAAKLVLPKDARNGDKLQIYRERSAIYLAERVTSPLLLLHGTDDTVVPIHQARIMVEALERKQVDVKLVEFEGEGHMLDGPSAARVWLEEEELWWRKTLT